MMEVLFDGVRWLLPVVALGWIVGMGWYLARAFVRVFEWWQVFRDPRFGTSLPLVVIDGRIFMDAMHPEAPFAVLALQKRVSPLLEEPESYDAKAVLRTRSFDGIH